MASLDDHTRTVAVEDRGWAAVHAVADGSVLLWSVLPQLALLLVGSEHAGDAPRLVADARNAARAFSHRRGPTLIRVGPFLVASTSGQNLRVLEPIVKALEARHGKRGPLSLPRLHPAGFSRERKRAAALARAVRSSLSQHDFGLPAGSYEEIVQTAVIGARAERLFATESPAALLVGTQHNSATRALIAAAHSHGGIRTVYTPHAPVADNPAYRDLPVHHALLRGPAEVAFYDALGTGTDRLVVVGDPSVSHRPTAAAPIAGAVVFAAPPRPVNELSGLIQVVAEAHLGHVEVAPHPRMGAAQLRSLCPPEWTFNPLSSTYERLASHGAAGVVQEGSGVGLEALGLGLPVANLLFPGRTPNYPYLADPLIANVHDSAELRTAVQDAATDARTAAARRDFARSWCSRVGADAAEAAADALESIIERAVPSEVILDGWATSEVH